MKMIEERAKEAWDNYEYREGELYQSCFTDGFINGAESERDELLRWRDPKKELPKQNKLVLLKTDEGIYTGSWWGGIEFGVYGNGFSRGLLRSELEGSEDDGYTCCIISWRPIEEL